MIADAWSLENREKVKPEDQLEREKKAAAFSWGKLAKKLKNRIPSARIGLPEMDASLT